MNKSYFSIILLSLLALQTSAAFSEVFSYASDELYGWGKGKKETVDVAIRIDNPALSGKKITEVSAIVNGGEGTHPVSIWITKDLTLKNKVNNPDICSMTPTVTDIKLNAEMNARKLDANLMEPYVLTDQPIYVGYSIEVSSVDTDADRNPILLSDSKNSNGLFIHASKSVLKWMDYSPSMKATPALYVTLEGDFGTADLGIVDIPNAYAKIDESFELNAVLCNIATEEVYTVDYSCTLGGKTSSYHHEFDSPIPYDIADCVKVRLPLEAMNELGTYQGELSIEKVNGENNLNLYQSSPFSLKVAPFIPVRRALLEEYTGTWCGWCVLGYACMEYIRQNYPELVCVAYHNADPMETVKTYPNSFSGFPAAFLDRGQNVVFTQTSALDVSYAMKAIGEQETPWYIDVSQEWESDKIIRANINVGHINGYDNKSYRLGCIFLCDSLSGNSIDWYQANNLPNQGYLRNDKYPEEINMFCQDGEYGKSKVRGLVFNDVVISSDYIHGIDDSLPPSLKEGEVIMHSVTLDISDIPLMEGRDKKNIRVVAFVMNADGRVLNCAKSMSNNQMTSTPALKIEQDGHSAPAQYYDLNGLKVKNPQHGIFIVREVDTIRKVIVK